MFCERLKELREEKRYSYRDLAALCGVSKSAIVMYEQGKRNPKREVLEAFADIFNVDMDYLLGRSDIRSMYADQFKTINKTPSALTEGEEMILELFRQIPEEQQKVFLEMGRVYANSLKKD